MSNNQAVKTIAGRRFKACGGSRGCGKRFLARRFPSGSWEVYCRACTARIAREHYARDPMDIEATCDECGEVFMMTRQRKAQIKSDLKLGRRRKDAKVYCGLRCANASHRKWPVNPRGYEYCRAPVRGGCPFLRKGKGTAVLGRFCHGHDKRWQRTAGDKKRRDAAMKKPIDLRLSAANRRARNKSGMSSSKIITSHDQKE